QSGWGFPAGCAGWGNAVMWRGCWERRTFSVNPTPLRSRSAWCLWRRWRGGERDCHRRLRRTDRGGAAGGGGGAGGADRQPRRAAGAGGGSARPGGRFRAGKADAGAGRGSAGGQRMSSQQAAALAALSQGASNDDVIGWVAATVRARMPRGLTLADVGCGKAALAAALRDHPGHYLGLDVVPYAGAERQT